jgi:uncharacterized protein
MRFRFALFPAVLTLGILTASGPLVGSAQDAPAPAANVDAQSARAIAAADRPSREQLITLFEVMRIRAQMNEMLKMVPAALQQQLQSEADQVQVSLLPLGSVLTPEQRAARDRVTQKYFALTESLYPVDDMLNDMIEVYQRHLTREDVDGIIAFYRSTPGQHILDAQPLMAKEVMPMVMKKMETRSKDLVDRYTKELNDAMGPPKVAPKAAPKS